MNNLEYAKSCMEGALTYMKDQLNTLWASLSTPLALPALIVSPLASAPVAPMAIYLIWYPILPMQSSTALVSAYVASSALASLTSTPSDHDAPSASDQSHVTLKVVQIPDPSIFYADSTKDIISYRDWHLQIRNKQVLGLIPTTSGQARLFRRNFY